MSALLPQCEGLSLEYKEAGNSLPGTFFETVCAFLNRDGGLVVLGVTDNGKVTGLSSEVIPLFEELSDRFSATIPLPGKGSSSEGTNILQVLDGEMSQRQIMHKLGFADEKHFRKQYQQRAVKAGVIELTIPEKPTSRLQKYRLAKLGRVLVERDRKP